MSHRSLGHRTKGAALAHAGAVLLVLLSVAGVSGCGDNATARSPSSATVPSGSAATPTFTRSAEPAVATTPGSSAPQASAAPSSEASAAPSSEPDAAPSAEAAAELPNVEIRNIGMHIGGEDNTPEQKRPIRNAVSKHYDDMRRCYAMAESPSKETTFGVDMRIGRDGGPAKISNPRSGFKSGEVKSCLVEVFEQVDFPKAKRRIPMMVSFSVRFRRR